MRDIYKALGLHPSAPDETIRERIELPPFNRRPEAQLAAEILLSEGRRRQYDRVHKTVRGIAFLRARTETSRTGYGRFPIYDDFRLGDAPPAQSNAEDAKRDLHPRSARTPMDSTDRKLFVWMFLIGSTVLYLGAKSAGWIPAEQSQDADELKTNPVLAPAFVPTTRTSSPQTAASTPAEAATRTQMPPLVRPGESDGDRRAASNPSTDTPRLRLLFRPEPLPETGDFDAGKRTDLSILVKTDPDGDHTFVKIAGVISGRTVAEGFIRAGERHTFYLPKGTYILKTATGETWFGRQALFGPETRYSKADDTFPLAKRGEQWTVELIRQTDGNLTESALDEAEF